MIVIPAPLPAEIIARPPGTDLFRELGLEPLGVGRPRMKTGDRIECRVRDPWRLPLAVQPGDRVEVSMIHPDYLRIARMGSTTEWEFPPPQEADPLASLTRWRVLIAADESLAIAPLREPVPAGWHDTGVRGTHRECLDRIDPRLQKNPDLSHPEPEPELFEPEPMLFAH